MSVSEGTAPRISGPRGEEGEGGEVEKFSVSRLEIVGLVGVGRGCPLRRSQGGSAEGLDIKAGIVLMLHAHSYIWLAHGGGRGG
jgi:hypothetical protein